MSLKEFLGRFTRQAMQVKLSDEVVLQTILRALRLDPFTDEMAKLSPVSQYELCSRTIGFINIEEAQEEKR